MEKSDVARKKAAATKKQAMMPWIQLDGRRMLADGRPVHLRGIGLGNWMLVEGFMIELPQVDYVMRQAFREVLGPERADAFWTAYMDSYFTEADVAAIRAMGFNHVRLPFSYRHIETDDRPGRYREEGFAMLDRMIGWCRKHGLWVMLDLHSAPGCQASDWNAESAYGEALLWDVEDYKQRMADMWRQIARRYRDEPTVMAYEVLNEPVTLFPYQVPLMNEFHHRCIAAIREEDRRHVIVINGDKHATDLRALDAETFADPQVMAAGHYYFFTSPLQQLSEFPATKDGVLYDEDYLVNKTGLVSRFAREKIARPEFLDEFGTGYHGPQSMAHRKMVGAIIAWCNRTGVHWNLWHWKDVRAMGICQMKPDAPWVRLLEKIGARPLREQCHKAVAEYRDKVAAFVALEGKRGHRLWAETMRDLEMQTLWTLVERMQDLSAADLAALGRSFTLDNFQLDAPMAAILEPLMAGE
jgi:endoglucanase